MTLSITQHCDAFPFSASQPWCPGFDCCVFSATRPRCCPAALSHTLHSVQAVDCSCISENLHLQTASLGFCLSPPSPDPFPSAHFGSQPRLSGSPHTCSCNGQVFITLASRPPKHTSNLVKELLTPLLQPCRPCSPSLPTQSQ